MNCYRVRMDTPRGVRWPIVCAVNPAEAIERSEATFPNSHASSAAYLHSSDDHKEWGFVYANATRRRKAAA